jgi:WD40 repeat protein
MPSSLRSSHRLPRVPLALAVLAALLCVAEFTRIPLFVAALSRPEIPPDRPPEPEPRKDVFGDPLPSRALVRLGTVRFRHAHNVVSLALSPDGKTLASAGHDHRARLWDLATGRQLASFGVKGEQGNPFTNSRWVRSIAFSPDGNLFATGEYAPGWSASTLRLWDRNTGQQRLMRNTQTAGILSLAFSPDSQALAVAGRDSTILLARGPAFTEWKRLGQHEDKGFPYKICFSPDGKSLASAGTDGNVFLWDLTTTRARRLPRHDGGAWGLAFSPDGKFLASGGNQGLRIYEVANSKEAWGIKSKQAIRDVAWSRDGKSIAFAEGQEAVLCDARAGKESKRLRAPVGMVQSLVFSGDGKKLAACAFPNNSIFVWDLPSGKRLGGEADHDGVFLGRVAFGLEGQVVVSAGADGTVQRWEAATGKLLGRMHTGHPTQAAVAWSGDGKVLIAGQADGSLSRFDPGNGKKQRTWPGHKEPVRAVALAPDNKVLASSGTGSVVLWDVDTSKKLGQLPAGGLPVQRLCFSPDGTHLAVADAQEIRLFEVKQGKELLKLSFASLSLAFSPDGKQLAAGGPNQVVRVWELPSGHVQHIFTGQVGYVLSVAFSPDGRTLAAGNWMNTRLYELASGQERFNLPTPQGDVSALAFSPDGKRLATGGADTTALIWDLTGWLTEGKRPEGKLTAAEFEQAWTDLANADARKAYLALWALAADPEQTLARLRERLRPAAAVDSKRVQRLIADLDSEEFLVRQKASEELARFGAQVVPLLKKILEGDPSTEVRQRIEALLDKQTKVVTSPEARRDRRGMEVLEQIDTPAAEMWLKRLASGAPESWITVQARAALGRRGKPARTGS